MKKILFISIIAILYSCSGSDDSNPVNQDESTINPPAWIQGNWESDTQVSFTFTDDNIIYTLFGQMGVNYKQAIELTQQTGQVPTVQEEITSSQYNVSITLPPNSEVYYKFKRISDTEFVWENNNNVVFTK